MVKISNLLYKHKVGITAVILVYVWSIIVSGADIKENNSEVTALFTENSESVTYVNHLDAYSDFSYFFGNKAETADEEVSSESLMPEEISSKRLISEEISSESLIPEEISSESLKPEEISSESLKPEEISSESLKPEEISSESLTTEEEKISEVAVTVEEDVAYDDFDGEIFEATYYYPGNGLGTSGYSGRELIDGYSVASNLFPMGTIIQIKGAGLDGIYRVDDKGATLFNKKTNRPVLDIFYDSPDSVPPEFANLGRVKLEVSPV